MVNTSLLLENLANTKKTHFGDKSPSGPSGTGLFFLFILGKRKKVLRTPGVSNGAYSRCSVMQTSSGPSSGSNSANTSWA